MYRLCKYGSSCCTGLSPLDKNKWCNDGRVRCLWLPNWWLIIDMNGDTPIPALYWDPPAWVDVEGMAAEQFL